MGGGGTENGPLAEKRQDRKSKRTRQKNRGDRKGKSNDSPEISDRGKTSDIPGLASQKILRFYIYAVCDLQVLLRLV